MTNHITSLSPSQRHPSIVCLSTYCVFPSQSRPTVHGTVFKDNSGRNNCPGFVYLSVQSSRDRKGNKGKMLVEYRIKKRKGRYVNIVTPLSSILCEIYPKMHGDFLLNPNRSSKDGSWKLCSLSFFSSVIK